MTINLPLMVDRVRPVAHVIALKIKSGLDLLGSVALAGVGAGIGTVGAMQARQPDAVLMQAAREIEKASHPISVGTWRDLYLVLLAVGVALGVYALYQIRAWFRPVKGG